MAERMSLDKTREKRESGQKPSSAPALVGNQQFKVFFGST